jgi:hypothetical protein
VATDSQNRTIVAGTFSTSPGQVTDFGNGHTATSTGGRDVFIAAYDLSGACVLLITFGGSGDDIAYGVAVDTADNIIVTGSFQQTTDFTGNGNGTQNVTKLTSAGAIDIFVAKYSSAGSLSWVKGYGSVGNDSGLCVEVDRRVGQNNAIVIGAYFQDTVDFGSGFVLSSSGNSIDIVLLKLTSGGVATWAKAYGSTSDEYVNALCIDKDGNIGITGQATGSTDLGGGAIARAGIFVAKYSGATGNFIWGDVKGNGGLNSGNGITTDQITGNFILTGGFHDGVDFGGGTLGGLGIGGIFFAMYDTAGIWKWAISTGGGNDFGYSVALDSVGNLVFSGVCLTAMNFGYGPKYGNGYYLVRMSLNLTHITPFFNNADANALQRSQGGTSAGQGIAFDSVGHFLTAGWFQDSITFNASTSLNRSGSKDGFIAQYNK